MAEYLLRSFREADRKQAAALWELVFGDPSALVEQFLNLFQFQPGFCMTAEQNGQIAAAAYCLDGLELRQPGQLPLPASYLYAVATHPLHRKQGLAAELCRRLRDACFARGRILFTKPAEESLYPWYEEKIGAVPALSCQTIKIDAAEDKHGVSPLMSLSPEEYGILREKLLQNIPHVYFPKSLLTWEHLLHKHYGGGFFAVGDGIADVYADGTQIEVPELLSFDPVKAGQALLFHFNAPAAVFTLPGKHEPYVSCAAPNGCSPDALDAVWFGPAFG